MKNMLYRGQRFLRSIKHSGWPWECGRRTSFCKALHVKNGRKCDQSEGSREIWSTFHRMVDSELNLNHQTVHHILTEELGMRTLGCSITLPSPWTTFWPKIVFQWFRSPHTRLIWAFGGLWLPKGTTQKGILLLFSSVVNKKIIAPVQLPFRHTLYLPSNKSLDCLHTDNSWTCHHIGESHLLWEGFALWGGALFHTRRCCDLCKSLSRLSYQLQTHKRSVAQHSVLSGRLCFGAMWNFCLSLNCDTYSIEGQLFFLISLVLRSLISVILNPCFYFIRRKFRTFGFIRPFSRAPFFSPIMGRSE
jgi:hypothetical protein